MPRRISHEGTGQNSRISHTTVDPFGEASAAPGEKGGDQRNGNRAMGSQDAYIRHSKIAAPEADRIVATLFVTEEDQRGLFGLKKPFMCRYGN